MIKDWKVLKMSLQTNDLVSIDEFLEEENSFVEEFREEGNLKNNSNSNLKKNSSNSSPLVRKGRPPGPRDPSKSLDFFEPVKKITPRHHTMARLVAEGLRDVDVAGMTGYTPTRIYQLKNDPLVKGLIEFYCAEMNARFRDVHERKKQLGLLAIERLMEKLLDDETGRSLHAKTLTEIAEFAIGKDKGDGGNGNFANGPVQVNISFGRDGNREELNGDKVIDLEVGK